MKKLIALFLSLILTLSLCGCGAEPVPAPDETVDALLAAVLRDDFAPLQALFGYKTPEDAANDLLDGENLRQAILDSADEAMLSSDIPLSSEDAELFGNALFAAMARCPFTCETASMDEDAGAATVSVTVNTYSAETFGDDLLPVIQPILLANLDKLDDEQALYSLVFKAVAGYLDELEPTDQTVSLDVPCKLVEEEINGKTRSVWLPEDEDMEWLGEQLTSAVFCFE